VGERKCAYEGCKALEFRTSGFCLRHKDPSNEIKKVSSTLVNESPVIYQDPSPFSILKLIGILLLIVGGLSVFLGILLMFPLSGGYELNELAGLSLIIYGGPVVVLGVLIFMVWKLLVFKNNDK
jgi:hypothetical protein